MLEGLILSVIVGLTCGVLWLARRHGIVLRADSGGLEALPKEFVEPTEKQVSGENS